LRQVQFAPCDLCGKEGGLIDQRTSWTDPNAGAIPLAALTNFFKRVEAIVAHVVRPYLDAVFAGAFLVAAIWLSSAKCESAAFYARGHAIGEVVTDDCGRAKLPSLRV
jgi:hypothetical protein